MRVLLTNDDGIDAKGIKTLYNHFKPLGEVYIVAPERERSASGHGITVHKPLRANEIEEHQFAVSGTPADCVKIALEALLPIQPDLIISGINLGANLGTDVLYSGTVSAAIEGILANIPSIAISLLSQSKTASFETAATVAVRLCELLITKKFPTDTLLNVNVPDCSLEDIKGLKVTTLGIRRYKNSIEERKDPRGNSYYWLGGKVEDIVDRDDTDVSAVVKNFVSVTPVHFDLTNYSIIDQIKDWDLNKLL